MIMEIENNFAGVHMGFSTARTVFRVLHTSTILYSVHSYEDGPCWIVLYSVHSYKDKRRKLLCTSGKLFSMMIIEIENNFAGVHMIFRIL